MAMSKANGQGSDELHEMHCELCKTKGRSRPAECFCVDCVKYFCSVCSENHSDFLPNHVLKDKFSMPQDVCLKPCAVHADEIIKFCCNSCKQFFCSQCKEKNHRECSSVRHLPQLVEKLELKTKTTDTCQALTNIINIVHKRTETVTNNMKSEEIRATKARTVLDRQSKAMTDWIENSRMQLTQEINKLDSSNKAMLQTEMSELDTIEMKTETLLKDISNKQNAGNKCELFMSLTIAEEMTNTDIVSRVRGSELTQYEFEISEDLNNILKEEKLGYVRKSDALDPFTVQFGKDILKTYTASEIQQCFASKREQFKIPRGSLFTTEEGIIIHVYTADITNLENVKCIVNAANETLNHGGGVAAAIAKCAGRNLEEDGKRYIRTYGKLKVGCNTYTTAGNLPYIYVIHTVGPKWCDYIPHSFNNVQNCEQDLYKAVQGSLETAEALGMETVALPAISSAIFGVPEDLCICQYVKATLDFSKSTAGKSFLKEIHFVDLNYSIIGNIQNEFKTVLVQKKRSPYNTANHAKVRR